MTAHGPILNERTPIHPLTKLSPYIIKHVLQNINNLKCVDQNDVDEDFIWILDLKYVCLWNILCLDLRDGCSRRHIELPVVKRLSQQLEQMGQREPNSYNAQGHIFFLFSKVHNIERLNNRKHPSSNDQGYFWIFPRVDMVKLLRQADWLVDATWYRATWYHMNQLDTYAFTWSPMLLQKMPKLMEN